jgi:oligopeptidase B
VELVHGDLRVDDYDWLRQKDHPDVLRYLEAENGYTNSVMTHTGVLQERLYQEMLGRIRESDLTVPAFDRGFWYYQRTEQGQAYPIRCRRRGSMDAPEEVYLNQNVRAAGHPFHLLGGVEVSPDGDLLLFLEDTTAGLEFSLIVKDLRTGAVVESLPDVWYGTAWAEDSRTFFYVTADPAKRGHAVWRHRLGTPRESDALVFREDDVLHNVSLTRSRSGRYVLIASDGFTSSEWRVIPTDDPEHPARIIAPRRPGVEYAVEHTGEGFLIHTNADARNFRIARIDEADPAWRWQEWLPHRDEVCVEAVEALRQHVVVTERVAGLRRFRISDQAGESVHYIEFPEQAYAVSSGANPDFESRCFRFTYSSPVTPPSVYDYDLETRERALRKQQDIPSGFDPTQYQVRRLMVPARDGRLVPVSLLLRHDARLDGESPLLLYGYGAYGTTTEASFSSPLFSLVDRGVGFAIAHVRGGQELGRPWYDAGKMLHKLNSFHDFIDVAEELIRRGYTSADRLIANGGSAGGLLVGAVANSRPELFRAIVAEVPFVDVINTLLDPSLPLTAQEWEQWGNPRVEQEYRYLLQYSPYDNVAARQYPWMLVTTSLNDSQVMYWEPAKWVARLRALKTDLNPLLLRTDMAGGHGGPSGRYDRLREMAFRYAFMLEAVGRRL